MAGFPLTRLVNREQLSRWFKLPQTVVAFESAQKDILELFRRALNGDAPADAATYGRKDSTWVRLDPPTPEPANAPILFKDEGAPLGLPGVVDEVDFVGAGVTASIAGSKVTVAIAPAVFNVDTILTDASGGVLCDSNGNVLTEA